MPYKGKTLVGLTGNIACGKSTVLRELRKLGAYTIDADERVHGILLKTGQAYGPVLAEFGPSTLDASGEIDRRALGRIVFADPSALKRLEAITHPIVRRVIEAEIEAAASPTVFLDAIKLFESGWADKCDAVWVVTCGRAQQLRRLMQRRGYSREEAEERIDAQAPQEEKIARANLVIDNSGTLLATKEQVRAAWQALNR